MGVAPGLPIIALQPRSIDVWLHHHRPDGPTGALIRDRLARLGVGVDGRWSSSGCATVPPSARDRSPARSQCFAFLSNPSSSCHLP